MNAVAKGIPTGVAVVALFTLTCAPIAAALDAQLDERNAAVGGRFIRVAGGSSADADGKVDSARSRDDLFGAVPAASEADAGGVKLGGFYQAFAGYTYTAPAHWSRAVNRVQLSAQGSLAKDIRWKVGGRVDVDPVYYGSDFYLPAVKNNQRADVFWRENYLDFSTGNWDFRVGAQDIIWGEVVGLFVADVVSARDMREFILPSFDVMRIPQWAVRTEYSSGDAHLDLVWIPVPVFDNIGRPGADFYPFPLPSPTPQALAALFANPDRPERKVANSNYGVRGNTLLDGWDVSAFYYRSFSTAPTFYRVSTDDPVAPPAYQPLYDRIRQAGGTVTKDFGEFVFRGEAVYTSGQSFESTRPTASRGVVQRDTFDYILSIDRPVFNDGRLNIQAFQRIYAGGKSDLALDPGDFGVSVLLSDKLGATIEPQILWIQTFGGGGALIRPKLSWYVSGNATAGFGLDLFTGPGDGYFGRYDNRDRIWADVRYTF